MWKNITIELPKLDLEYLSNELFNLDIISVLIEKKNKLASATSREFRPGQGMMTSSSSQPPAKSIALYQLLVADYSSKSHVKDVPFYPNRTCGWLVHELSTLREARALNRAVVELAWRKELPSHMRDALMAAASSKTRTGGWVM